MGCGVKVTHFHVRKEFIGAIPMHPIAVNESTMTDIQKHAPKVFQLLRTQLQAAPRNLDPVAHEAIKLDIRNKLLALLPSSYGIGTGPIINTRGQASLPLPIIYDKAKAGGQDYVETFPLSHILMAIDIRFSQDTIALAASLETMQSVKALKNSQKIRILPPPPLDLSTRIERIPKHILPLCVIFSLRAQNDFPVREVGCESFCNSLHTLITKYPTIYRPDYIFALDDAIVYRDRALDGLPYHTYDIGLLREPDHSRFLNCYVCKTPFFRRHFFYDRLCPHCGDLNYTKRQQSANLHGKIALVTGARIKIGYAVALKLLRAGATVIATTRFAHDAALRYSKEPDFAAWSNRLHIYGLDLRHLPAIEYFINEIKQTFSRLDILINNAAQTVRRPPAFYAHLIPFELVTYTDLPTHLQPLLQHEQKQLPVAGNLQTFDLIPAHGIHHPVDASPTIPHMLSAMLSQVPLVEGDEQVDQHHFPPDKFDKYGQQLDLRTENSWVQKLEDVSIPEIVEVQLVNAIAPTMLIHQCKPLMNGMSTLHTYIINVSAIEGQFASTKNGYHPHTNMAKAALNMLTYSSSADFAEQYIFMNSVDPGWVSDQVPLSDMPEGCIPLDEDDAAARICDPIFTDVNTNQQTYGKLLKDYIPVSW